MENKSILKKAIYLVIILLLPFILVACDDDEQIPQNLKIEEGILTWDEVEGASKYIVLIGEVENIVSSNSFDLKTISLEIGEYKIKVKAYLETDYGEYSKEIEYPVTTVALIEPTNLSVENNIISWSSIPHAKEYEVRVGNEKRITKNNSISLSEFEKKYGEVRIVIKAIGEGGYLSSEFSDALDYIIDINDEDLINEIAKFFRELDFPEEYVLILAEQELALLLELTKNTDFLNAEILKLMNLLMSGYSLDNPEGLDKFLAFFADEEFDNEQIVQLFYNLLNFILSEGYGEIYFYITNNEEKVKAGFYPLVKSFRNSYLDSVDLINKIINSEELQVSDFLVLKNILLNSSAFPTATEFEDLIDLLKDIISIYFETLEVEDEELKTRLFNTIINLLDFLNEIYQPVLDNFKELIKSININDLELFDPNNILEVLIELSLSLEDNPVITQNNIIIMEAVQSLFFEKKIEILPYIISGATGIPLDDFELFIDFLFKDEELILNGFDELIILLNNAINLNFDDYLDELSLDIINWEYLALLEPSDIREISRITKEILINFYLEIEEVKYTERNLDEAIDVDSYSEIFSLVLNILALNMEEITRFSTDDKFLDDCYHDAIDLFKALDNLYESELANKFDNLDQLLNENFIENEVLISVLIDLGFEVAENPLDLLNLVDNQRDIYLTIKDLSAYDPDNLSSLQKEEINELMLKIPVLNSIFIPYTIYY